MARRVLERIRRGSRRYLRWSDVGQVVMTLAALALAVNTKSESASATAAAAVVYVVALVGYSIAVLRSRRGRDHIKAEVVWTLFAKINKDIFREDQRLRFTLLCPDPLRADEIIPIYRFFIGGAGPIEEASQSRARYKRGEGLTGQAWANVNQLHFEPLPVFASHAEMVAYYVTRLNVRKEVANDISDRMVSVQSIFSCGFTDGAGKFLGVLSIDVSAPMIARPHGWLLKGNGSTPDLEIQSFMFQQMLSMVRSVLMAFQRAKG